MQRRTSGSSLLALLLLLALCEPARAQNQLNLQTFRPAAGPENVITVEGSRTAGHLRPIAAVFLEYAYRPLVLRYDTGEIFASTVTNMATAHVIAGLGITRFLSFAVALPVVVFQDFDERTPIDLIPFTPRAYGLGDLRLIAKGRILNNERRGLGLAFVPQVSFPTGDTNALRSDEAFGFEPRVALDYRFERGIFIALNVGLQLRTADQRLLDVYSSHQLRYGLGAHVPLFRGLGISGELSGAASLVNAAQPYTPLEGYLAARYVHKSGLQVDLGGGAGLIGLASSPLVRVFASIGYLPMGRPVPKAPPRPVEPPKPRVLDSDGDGIADDKDQCPKEAEDKDGFQDDDGCPDLDDDGDGVPDTRDQCPKEAEDMDQFQDDDGCPDIDDDGDGIADSADKCPRQLGPADNEGCPDTDRDRDGVVDRMDKCPDENGPPPVGCPERRYLAVRVDRIELRRQIHFATGKGKILPDSFSMLTEVAEVLVAQPKLFLRIEGHTDNKGKPKKNLLLSQARAEAVQAYLVQAGVARERLVARGYGDGKPQGDNKTAQGREQNRRTDFFIITAAQLAEEVAMTPTPAAEPEKKGKKAKKERRKGKRR